MVSPSSSRPINNIYNSHFRMNASQRCYQYARIFCHQQKRGRKPFYWLCGLLVSLILLGIAEPWQTLLDITGSSAPPVLYPFPPSPHMVRRVDRYLSRLTITERLNYVVYHQPFRVVQVTSLGPTGMVLLDLMHKNQLLDHVPVWTIDTLHLFPETIAFYKTVQETYSIDLKVLRPKSLQSKEAFDHEYGADLYKTDPEKYAFASKVEPLQDALTKNSIQLWMTGRRKDQGGERSSLAFCEMDGEDRLKLNLMADWTYDQVWDYIHKHNVPYNPLHDRGYKSVGDTMTTRAVADTAPERSGRFVGLNQTECGLHHHLEKLKVLKQEAADQNVEFELPALPCNVCDLDVTPDSFEKEILHARQPVLLEFYSPLCGACQEFAPTFHAVAKQLKKTHPNRIRIARFDITTSDISPAMATAGYEVNVTPTLYLVKPSANKDNKPRSYDGEFEKDLLLQWVTNLLD